MGLAARVLVPRISDDDPVLRAILNAPIEDMPETEQERLDVEEARADGRFVSASDVSRRVAERAAARDD